MRYLARWILHYQCCLRDRRGGHICIIYQAGGVEIAGAASKSLEAWKWGYKLDGIMMYIDEMTR